MSLNEPPESLNPYQATAIDEKSIDAATFFRAELKYVKLVPCTVGRTAYATFMRYKWRFITIEILHVVLLFSLVVFVLYSMPSDFLFSQYYPWWFPLFRGVAFVLHAISNTMLCVIVVTVSVSESLRILRKEQRLRGSVVRKLISSIRESWHVFLFLLTCVFIFVAAFSPVYLTMAYFDGALYSSSNKELIAIAVFLIMLFITGIMTATYVISRTGFAMHFIVDREQNFLAAMHRGGIRAATARRSPFDGN